MDYTFAKETIWIIPNDCNHYNDYNALPNVKKLVKLEASKTWR